MSAVQGLALASGKSRRNLAREGWRRMSSTKSPRIGVAAGEIGLIHLVGGLVLEWYGRRRQRCTFDDRAPILAPAHTGVCSRTIDAAWFTNFRTSTSAEPQPSPQFTSPASDYRQNHGRPGVVYILENPGLRQGWWKIGCSTRSGHHRARDLNEDAATGTPGAFQCVYEFRTLDCGLAEERVFARLVNERRGKRGQEYFEVELAQAQEVIASTCLAVDDEVRPAPQSHPTAPVRQFVPDEAPARCRSSSSA
jgi:hypothetical protein